MAHFGHRERVVRNRRHRKVDRRRLRAAIAKLDNDQQIPQDELDEHLRKEGPQIGVQPGHITLRGVDGLRSSAIRAQALLCPKSPLLVTSSSFSGHLLEESRKRAWQHGRLTSPKECDKNEKRIRDQLGQTPVETLGTPFFLKVGVQIQMHSYWCLSSTGETARFGVNGYEQGWDSSKRCSPNRLQSLANQETYSIWRLNNIRTRFVDAVSASGPASSSFVLGRRHEGQRSKPQPW